MFLQNIYSAPLKSSRNYVALNFVGAVAIAFILTTIINLLRKTNETVRPTKIKERYKATVRSFDSFFSDLLPYTFRYNTAVTVFIRNLIEEHDCILFSNNARKQYQSQAERNEVWLLVCFKLLTLLSCNVVLAILYYPSNNPCSGRDFKGCERNIKVDTIGSLCSWNANNSVCESSSANDTFGFTLTVLFVSMCATSLLDKLFKFILSHAALAVKTRRLGWLYSCCLRSTDLVVPVPVLRGGKNSQVLPVKGWERGRYTLGMPATALVIKPTQTQAYSNSSKVFVAEEWEGSGQDATLTLSLEEAEKGLEHFGDEWKALSVQSRQSTVFRAARFAIMKQNMDYISAALELQNMLIHSRERYLWMEAPDKPFRTVNWFDALRASFRLKQLSWFHFGDPVTALEFMDLAHLHHQEKIDQKLRDSRRRATELRAGMMRRQDGQEREAFLLKAFIAHSLCGYKRVVACSVLFDTDDVAHARIARVIWQYIALMLTPLLLLVLLGITFYGALAVPKGSTEPFLYCGGLSLALNVLWQQPAVIWLLRVWFPSTAKRDVLALHWVLQVRARTILTRRWGLLHTINALVQHFHPACRAARLQPHLPVARLLMSLSDYDLPVSAVLRRPRRRAVVYPTVQVLNTGSPLVYDFCQAVGVNLLSQYRWCYALVTLCVMSVLRLALHGLYLLPVWMRETVVEMGCSGSLLGLLALLHYTVKTDASGATTGIVLGMVVLCVGVSIYKINVGLQREKEVLARLKCQAERYQIPCSTFTATN